LVPRSERGGRAASAHSPAGESGFACEGRQSRHAPPGETRRRCLAGQGRRTGCRRRPTVRRQDSSGSGFARAGTVSPSCNNEGAPVAGARGPDVRKRHAGRRTGVRFLQGWRRRDAPPPLILRMRSAARREAEGHKRGTRLSSRRNRARGNEGVRLDGRGEIARDEGQGGDTTRRR
jgi:hypothetical protein